MGRSGYQEDFDYEDPLAFARWRGQVASAIRGKRGQQFFRGLIEALDAMPQKRLIKDQLVSKDGEVCALGQLGRHQGKDMSKVDEWDWDGLGGMFNIAHQLAQETMYINDEEGYDTETPEHRWARVRRWAEHNLRKNQDETSDSKISPRP